MNSGRFFISQKITKLEVSFKNSGRKTKFTVWGKPRVLAGILWMEIGGMFLGRNPYKQLDAIGHMVAQLAEVVRLFRITRYVRNIQNHL